MGNRKHILRKHEISKELKNSKATSEAVVSGSQGFPKELTPRGKPCCIVRILEECVTQQAKPMLLPLFTADPEKI